MDLRIAVSDVHKWKDGADACDVRKVARLVAEAIQRRILELLLLGDVWDITRGGRGSLYETALFFGQVVGAPLAAAGIPVCYRKGNHDRDEDLLREFVHALVDAGFHADLLQLSTGPEPEVRGPWRLDHGSGADPWCREGSLLTPLGEAFTRLDAWANFNEIDPALEHPEQVPEVESSYRKALVREMARTGERYRVVGHDHLPGEVTISGPRGMLRLLDCGSMTVGTPYAFAWISDSGEGGVEIERSL